MGKSRANAEYMQPQPTATERLQKALNRPVNEAIKTDDAKQATEIKAVPTPGLLGTGGAANAARAQRTRKQAMDDQLND